MRAITTILVFALAVTAAAVSGAASNVGVDLNIHVGTPTPPPVVVAPPPPIYPPPPPPPPRVAVPSPPVFVMPPSLGFYAAVGIPDDLFYLGGTFYLFQRNVWYSAPYYNGPWGVVPHKQLPPKLRKQGYDRIIQYRDREYQVYRAEQHHYRGHSFTPDREWREQQKWEKERRKEEKKREKEERKEHKRHGHGD